MELAQQGVSEYFPEACWAAVAASFLIAAERVARLYFWVCAVPANGVGNPKKFQANRENWPRLIPASPESSTTRRVP